LAAIDPNPFEHAVAVKKPVIENADGGLVLFDQFAGDVDLGHEKFRSFKLKIEKASYRMDALSAPKVQPATIILQRRRGDCLKGGTADATRLRPRPRDGLRPASRHDAPAGRSIRHA